MGRQKSGVRDVSARHAKGAGLSKTRSNSLLDDARALSKSDYAHWNACYGREGFEWVGAVRHLVGSWGAIRTGALQM